VSARSKPPETVWLEHSGDEPHILREILRTHQTLMNVFSRQVGMPPARLALLRLLANAGLDGLGVMKIARRLSVNAAAITRLVKEMEDRRLVSKRRDSRDGRRSYVRLTRKGQQTFRQIHERGHEFERALGASLGNRDMKTAARVLSELRAALEEYL